MPNIFHSIVLALLACSAAGCSEAPPSAPEAQQSLTATARKDPALGAWMKANAAPAMVDRDAAALERAFARITTFAPDGYADWTTITARGARAARADDLEGCRAACRACHEAHRDRYRKEQRERGNK